MVVVTTRCLTTPMACIVRQYTPESEAFFGVPQLAEGRTPLAVLPHPTLASACYNYCVPILQKERFHGSGALSIKDWYG